MTFSLSYYTPSFNIIQTTLYHLKFFLLLVLIFNPTKNSIAQHKDTTVTVERQRDNDHNRIYSPQKKDKFLQQL